MNWWLPLRLLHLTAVGVCAARTETGRRWLLCEAAAGISDRLLLLGVLTMSRGLSVVGWGPASFWVLSASDAASSRVLWRDWARPCSTLTQKQKQRRRPDPSPETLLRAEEGPKPVSRCLQTTQCASQDERDTTLNSQPPPRSARSVLCPSRGWLLWPAPRGVGRELFVAFCQPISQTFTRLHVGNNSRHCTNMLPASPFYKLFQSTAVGASATREPASRVLQYPKDIAIARPEQSEPNSTALSGPR